ncbi:MAG: DUF5050 domain-containing protein, partial [Acidobacteria bacterium]|nr:DUF5050 domain-containing protein [Acidobacteriota bacterium]
GEYLLRRVGSREVLVSELEEWAETVKEGAEPPEDQVALWQMQISEVATNGFQHGIGTEPPENEDRGSILVAGRAYPDTKVVQLAALDFGATIPRVIQHVAAQLGRRRRRDSDLISFACKKGVTSRSVPQNQGAGLHSLVETVKQNKGGSLLILSGNGLCCFSDNGENKKTLSPMVSNHAVLEGTLTIINLKIA